VDDAACHRLAPIRPAATALAAAALWALGALALPSGGGAQGVHPLPPQARPLHRRLGLADAAAVVRIERVATGRITAERREVLLGDVPERFEIKRSPSKPPPLEEGDLALVLLRGARPPYVLVDEPRETIRLAGEAMQARWTDVLRRVAQGRGDPDELADLYLAWIDAGPDSLREIAFQGLRESAASSGPLLARISMDRARAAADPARAPEARRLSALLAVGSPEATAKLLPSIPGKEAQPAVVLIALRGAAAYRHPDGLDALARGLSHADPAVRGSALQALPSLATAFGPQVLFEAERLAVEDPHASVRRQAGRSLRAARDVLSAEDAATP
jgi:hypothetical protein